MSASSAEALALVRAGRQADAERALRAAIDRDAADADCVHLLGFILATSGRAPEGLALLDRSVQLDPRNAGFLDNRGQVLMQMGLLDEAERDARAATGMEPRFPEGWLHLAQVLRRQRRGAESLDAARRALALDASHVGAHYHAALVHMELGQREQAAAGFARVLEGEPGHAAAHNNLGLLQREAGRDDLAAASFARAVAAEPGNAAAHHNLGVALRGAGRLEEAFAAFTRAGFPESLANAGGLALELERLEEARTAYTRAAAANPGFPDPIYGLGQVALREHRFAEGWAGYDQRFRTSPPLASPRELSIPPLRAADLARARRVAIWSEQGLGDQILFTTLLPELAARGIGAVVEVDPRLLGLYRRGLPDFEFTTREHSAQAFHACDFQIPMGSLPRLFRPDAASFAAQPRALLVADPARVEEIRALLDGRHATAISWRSVQGAERRALAARKSVPLEVVARAALRTGDVLLDLQYGDVDAERAAYEARHPGRIVRVPGLDAREDLEGVAAALVACGHLVSASNATAHLAGALGVETRLLLPRGWPPFFYWVAGAAGRALWYPSLSISPVD